MSHLIIGLLLAVLTIIGLVSTTRFTIDVFQRRNDYPQGSYCYPTSLDWGQVVGYIATVIVLAYGSVLLILAGV